MTPSDRPGTARRTARTRLLAGAGLAVLLGGFVAAVLAGRTSDQAGVTSASEATTPSGTTPSPPPRQAKNVRIPVRGVGAFDPDGDRSENDSTASLATDGDLATAWKSERYRRSFAKSGVGLVLDATLPVRVNRVVVVTETPGFIADVRVGSSATGPFVAVSSGRSLTPRTTIGLKPRRARYVMLWITSMPEEGAAAVNEIRVSGAR